MLSETNRKHLEIYLQDHSAGAVGAIELLEHLCEVHAAQALGTFLSDLTADVKADHEQLHNLMTKLGLAESPMRNAGAWLAEKFGRAKLGATSGESPALNLFQALETLSLGITGKRALWRALAAADAASPVLAQTDFALLEQRAVEQIERVEAQRLESARMAFCAH